MKLIIQLKEFIKEHAEADVNKLLLSASRYPDIDVSFAVEQIKSRKQIKDKLPSWWANEELIFPSKIAAEQCSSEQTGVYKQCLIDNDVHLCDLTGGLGIDSFFFSQKAKHVTYIERFETYCDAAKHNFAALGATNITVLNGDSSEIFPSLKDIDAFYVDPARRGTENKRVFALHDCEPDLGKLLPLLFAHAPKVIAKLSPMADIDLTLTVLENTSKIHVVSVKNECKELLFAMDRDCTDKTLTIQCINFNSNGVKESFIFEPKEEKATQIHYTHHLKRYLYEPNSSILKAGAFKSITRLGVEKLHTSSHLYTSDTLIEEFPGRTFVIDEVLPFNNKVCKKLSTDIPQANITVRNFPVSVDELRKKTKIADGGTIYLFATTLSNNDKVLIRCSKG